MAPTRPGDSPGVEVTELAERTELTNSPNWRIGRTGGTAPVGRVGWIGRIGDVAAGRTGRTGGIGAVPDLRAGANAYEPMTSRTPVVRPIGTVAVGCRSSSRPWA